MKKQKHCTKQQESYYDLYVKEKARVKSLTEMINSLFTRNGQNRVVFTDWVCHNCNGRGCEKCGFLGYQSRIEIQENKLSRTHKETLERVDDDTIIFMPPRTWSIFRYAGR